MAFVSKLLKTPHQVAVENFMRLAGQEVPKQPTSHVSVPTRILRAKLILEECLETIYEGLGVTVSLNLGSYGTAQISITQCDFETHDSDINLVELIDGCCDIKVVTTGTLSACGVPDLLFQEEVDQNNLDKFGPGGYRREDGKWVKPPEHKPPRIEEILTTLECLEVVETTPEGDYYLVDAKVVDMVETTDTDSDDWVEYPSDYINDRPAPITPSDFTLGPLKIVFKEENGNPIPLIKRPVCYLKDGLSGVTFLEKGTNDTLLIIDMPGNNYHNYLARLRTHEGQEVWWVTRPATKQELERLKQKGS